VFTRKSVCQIGHRLSNIVSGIYHAPNNIPVVLSTIQLLRERHAFGAPVAKKPGSKKDTGGPWSLVYPPHPLRTEAPPPSTNASARASSGWTCSSRTTHLGRGRRRDHRLYIRARRALSRRALSLGLLEEVRGPCDVRARGTSRDDATQVFPVKIGNTVSVGALKKVVKEENQQAFHNLDVCSLAPLQGFHSSGPWFKGAHRQPSFTTTPPKKHQRLKHRRKRPRRAPIAPPQARRQPDPSTTSRPGASPAASAYPARPSSRLTCLPKEKKKNTSRRGPHTGRDIPYTLRPRTRLRRRTPIAGRTFECGKSRASSACRPKNPL
jgi:hypothetical protein